MLKPTAEHHYHFVTGKLAEASVRKIVAQSAGDLGFHYSIGVMPITVAALITPKWLLRHLRLPAGVTHVIVPGYCESGLDALEEEFETEIPDEEAEKITSVQEAIDYVNANQ